MNQPSHHAPTGAAVLIEVNERRTRRARLTTFQVEEHMTSSRPAVRRGLLGAGNPIDQEQMVELQKHVAEIVSAYLRKNHVSADQLTSTLTTVHDALAALGKAEKPVVALTPAVPVRRSVRPDQIICLECGWSGKTMRRHLAAVHGVTPVEYRTRWSLLADYPMVAPNYAAERSEFAKSIGLGARGRGRKGDTASQQASATHGD